MGVSCNIRSMQYNIPWQDICFSNNSLFIWTKQYFRGSYTCLHRIIQCKRRTFIRIFRKTIYRTHDIFILQPSKRNKTQQPSIIFFFIMFFSFSEFQTLSRRFSYLFIYAYWIIWIDFIKCFSIENNKKLFISFIFVYCILRTGISTYLPDFDYENVLFGKTKSYQERLYLHNRTYDGP